MEASPEKWREASIQGMKLAQVIIGKSDKALNDTKIKEPLPMLRDFCIQQSNDRIRAYMRATRAVVVKLRRTHAAVNDEMKSVNRCKESLEKALEHKQKDLVINMESQELRSSKHKPLSETDVDATETLLKSERYNLLSSKRTLEAHLYKIQVTLQELAAVRGSLAAVIQERSRVTDLLCQAISFPTDTPKHKRTLTEISLRKSPSQCSSYSSSGSDKGSVVDGRPPTRMSSRSCGSGGHKKARSAPVPLEIGTSSEKEDTATTLENSDPAFAGPHDAVSAEALQSLHAAAEVIVRSGEVRQDALKAIDYTHQLQQASHDTIQETLVKKIAHTVTLTDHLAMNSGETKLAYQRSTRHYNAQQKTLGYLLGPVSSADMTTRERLDRPMVKMYQRHMGKDLPDAAQLIKATDETNDAMDTTMKNMALLKLASKGLEVDYNHKKKAASLDSSVVRLRRRKANHRWVLQGSAYPIMKPSSKHTIKSLSQ